MNLYDVHHFPESRAARDFFIFRSALRYLDMLLAACAGSISTSCSFVASLGECPGS